MIKNTLRKHSASFKAQVVLAALRQDKTIAELCQEFDLKASQIYTWRNKALEHMNEAFKKGSKSSNSEHEKEIETLHQKIGKLTVERDFLERVWSQYQRKRGNK